MKRRGVLLLLLLLPLAVYLPNLGRQLIWDSKPMIMENALLQAKFSPAAPFRSGYWETTSQRSDAGYDYYRPLTVLSFMIEKAAWGLSPWRLRLVNLLLFIAALFPLYLFLLRQAAPPGAAETAALLFALFPLHVDNINWVVGRSDLLLLLFGLLALLLFDHFLEKKSLWLGLLALASFAIAILSKEAALFFLPVFPLHELVRRRRLTLALTVPPLFVAAAFWLLKSAAIGRAGFPIRPFPTLMENVLPPLGTLGYYLRSLVFPFAYDMSLPVAAVQALPYLVAGILFVLLLALLPILGRRRPALLLGWSWAVPFLAGSLLLLFTPIQPFNTSTRYLTVPLIGWTWLLAQALALWRPHARRAALAVLLAASSIAVIIHSQKYRNETVFWKSALASCPNDSFFLTKYAGQLGQEGEFIRGEALLRRALTQRMKNHTAVAIALQMAEIAYSQARYDQSLDWLEKMRALKLDLPHQQQRRHWLLKVHWARSDLAAAEAIVNEMTLGLPAAEAAAKRVDLYLASGEWRRAHAALVALPGSIEVSRAMQEEEARFAALDPGDRASFFIRRGNFAKAWEAWPDKDATGIAEQLQAARLALLAGREEEGQRRIARLAKEHAADGKVLNSVGNVLFDLKRADEALPFYENSLRLNPAQSALGERVAWIRQGLEEARH